MDRYNHMQARSPRAGARGFLLWAALVFAALPLGISKAQENAQDNVQAKTQRNDNVVAAYYPPLMIHTGEAGPGIAVEILRAAARRIGRTVSLEFQPFERALYTMKESPDTLMAALFRTPAREDLVQWIAEIDRSRLVFLTLDVKINTLEDARHLTAIGVESGTTGDDLLTRHGFHNISRVAEPAQNARMLDAGRIDAWLLTPSLANTIWHQEGHTQRLIAGTPIIDTPIYLAAGLGFPKDVAARYRAAIAAMHADGSIDDILTSYRESETTAGK